LPAGCFSLKESFFSVLFNAPLETEQAGGPFPGGMFPGCRLILRFAALKKNMYIGLADECDP